MTRHRLAALVVLAAAAAGCSNSDSIESTEPEPTPSLESTTSDVEPTTTVADTTTTSSTLESTTTSTTSSAPPTTTEPTSTTAAPPSTAAPGPAPPPPGRAFVTTGADLLEVDAGSGAAIRTVTELFNGDGVFRGNLRLSPDGATLWFSEGYEDGWYGCETSVGSFGRVDVATGAVETVGVGSGAEPSPDGALVAYLASDLCLPDPENPELWVLTPYDRVVVRDLATGDERVFVTNPAPEDYSSPTQVEWAGFAPDGALLVATTDAQLRRVDLAGSGVIQEHPVVVDELRGIPFGVSGGALVTLDFGDEGSVDAYAVDLASGAATPLATSEEFVTAGIAANGAIVMAGFGDVAVEPGAPVTVLTAPDDGVYYDIDW